MSHRDSGGRSGLGIKSAGFNSAAVPTARVGLWPICSHHQLLWGPVIPGVDGLTVRDHVQTARKRQRSTYIKESLVTRVLRGAHAGASRDDHFYFSQVDVAFTACVLTRVIVPQLEPKDTRGIRDPGRGNSRASQKVSEYFPISCSTTSGRTDKKLKTVCF